MTDWKEHDGGPQPVAKGVWVRRFHRNYPGEPFRSGPQLTGPHDCWKDVEEYQVLNQPLIDAALKRGIELGLEAAAWACVVKAQEFISPAYAVDQPMSSFAERFACGQCADKISALDPDTIAKEAQHD